MNTNPSPSLLICRTVVALTCIFAGAVCAAPSPDPAGEDFTPLATAVVRLLESGDAAAFAKAVAPSIEDWRAVAATNRNDTADDPLGPAWQKSLDRQRQQLESGAKAVLAKAAELKVDFARLRLTGKALPPKSLGTTRYNSIQAEGESLAWAEKVDIVVTAQPLPDAQDAERLGGEYRLSLANPLKFPAGWRCQEGVRWVSFPNSVADENTQRELAILTKVAARQGITLEDDPALAQLAGALVRFIRTRDATVYENEAMLSLEAVWSMIQKMSGERGTGGPSRAELEKEWAVQRGVMFDPAKTMVETMERHGIDLKEAEIEVRAAGFKRASGRGVAGSLDGLSGDQLLVALAVKAGGQSKSGQPLSGEYVIAAEEALRLGDRWLISRPVRWEKFPAGVIDEKTAADMRFESYVAEHGSLPPDTAAPDIEFVRVDNEQKGRLADWRGKVVILEFWATWCGPCQEPMAKLQKYREENPDWKDRVEVVSLSIDDTLKPVPGHLQKRGWTNSFNVWARPGGWQSDAAKSFRVTGMPTCYIINAEGKIVQAGHPMSVRAPEVVNRLLK